ncbi:MAG: response regulator transcription factor [Campylobacterota bacterium]|nr:response regulator transcription factor [Campylobacterota bacterium]
MFDPMMLYNISKHFSILIVEDHHSLRQRVVEILDDFFYRVDEAEDGVEALEKYNAYYETHSKYYDLIISDIQMPRMNGIDLTAEIYSINEDQPIIILSAHQDANYLLALINFGVAQFITKPIEQEQMLQTLYNVCKKLGKPTSSIIENNLIDLGNEFIWYKKENILKCSCKEVILTKHETIFMEILTQHIDKVCSTDEILNHFFIQNIDLSPENVRSAITRLRKKLPKDSISSIYGLGYKLTSL